MLQLKNIFLLLSLFLFSAQFYGQQKKKDFRKIMHSTSIYEIDGYLRIAHPDDPKRAILKPRLVEMLYEYIKYAHPADPKIPEFQEKIALLRKKPSTRISYAEMTEIIKQTQIAKYKEDLRMGNFGSVQGGAAKQNSGAASFTGSESLATLDAKEQEEFTTLMASSPKEHKDKTVKILNSLFDNDPNSKESIVMIENKSDCDMIVRIVGAGDANYSVPVAAHSDNSIVVLKGDYLFTSKLCGAQYAAQKSVKQAIMVSLSMPTK